MQLPSDTFLFPKLCAHCLLQETSRKRQGLYTSDWAMIILFPMPSSSALGKMELEIGTVYF